MTDALLDRLPYARLLGLQETLEGRTISVVMPYHERLIGNPMLPALHGGSTAALLEMTAIAQVAHDYPRLRLPRPINVSIAYLRTGRALDVTCQATLFKAGRRVAHVTARAWQDDPDSPIATLVANFMIDVEK